MRLGAAIALAACAASAAPPVRADVTAPAKIAWRTDLKAAEREAGKRKRPLIVFFSAEWCMPCKEMLARTFTAPPVVARITQAYVPLLIDVTNDDDAAATAARTRFHVEALPTLLVVEGSRVRLQRGEFLDAAALATLLQTPR